MFRICTYDQSSNSNVGAVINVEIICKENYTGATIDIFNYEDSVNVEKLLGCVMYYYWSQSEVRYKCYVKSDDK